MKHSVLFVCTANICRSPMAVGLLQAILADEGRDWCIESAGVWADYGYPAAGNTQKVVKARGVSLQDHVSRPITHQMVADFNLVLVMERNHKEALQVAFPELAGRVYLLSEMVGKHDDIIDPIGGKLADFEETATEIENIFREGFERIALLSGQRQTAD